MGSPGTGLDACRSDRREARRRPHVREGPRGGFLRVAHCPGGARLDADTAVRAVPSTSPEKVAARRAQAQAYAAKVQTGGFDAALTRAVLYVTSADRTLDERSAVALNGARKELVGLPLGRFKALVREQYRILLREPERALTAFAVLVPNANDRQKLFHRLAQLSRLLELPPASVARSI